MLPSIITKIVSSTYCNLKGTNVSMRFGHLGMSAEQVLENMLEGVVCFVSKLNNYCTKNSFITKTFIATLAGWYSTVHLVSY